MVKQYLRTLFGQKLIVALLEPAKGRDWPQKIYQQYYYLYRDQISRKTQRDSNPRSPNHQSRAHRLSHWARLGLGGSCALAIADSSVEIKLNIELPRNGQWTVAVTDYSSQNAPNADMKLQYRDQTWFFMHKQSPGPVGGVENRGFGLDFQHLPRDLANVNALKNHVRSLLLHKNWKHMLHFALFLALFCFAFSPNAFSTYCACSRAGRGSTHLVTAAILWPGMSILKVA